MESGGNWMASHPEATGEGMINLVGTGVKVLEGEAHGERPQGLGLNMCRKGKNRKSGVV